jgi:hypothetical protein
MDANSLFQFFPDATTSGKERIVLGTKKKENQDSSLLQIPHSKEID